MARWLANCAIGGCWKWNPREMLSVLLTEGYYLVMKSSRASCPISGARLLRALFVLLFVLVAVAGVATPVARAADPITVDLSRRRRISRPRWCSR